MAEDSGIPVLRLKKPDRTRWDDRKLDHVRPYLAAAEHDGRYGVVAVVTAQEFQWVFSGRDSRGSGFTLFKEQRRVGVYYFYILDPDFGPGFIKICTYFPYPAKVWVNGHEWAKCQAAQAGIGFRALANGFAACDEPEWLQGICDGFGPGDVQGFFDRWIATVPRRSPALTGRPGTGGSFRCARWRPPGPLSWTTPAEPEASSSPWWPTTWASVVLTRWRLCSPAGSPSAPLGSSAPGSSGSALRSSWSSPTSTAGSSST